MTVFLLQQGGILLQHSVSRNALADTQEQVWKRKARSRLQDKGGKPDGSGGGGCIGASAVSVVLQNERGERTWQAQSVFAMQNGEILFTRVPEEGFPASQDRRLQEREGVSHRVDDDGDGGGGD
jgi:hypothetical protein